MKMSKEEIKAIDDELKQLEKASKLSVKQHQRRCDLEYSKWCADFEKREYHIMANTTKTFKETKKTSGVCIMEWGKHVIEV